MKLIAPNKENHKALWHWLGDHPVRPGGYFTDKEDWPGFKTMIDHFITTPKSLCFACEECEGMCLICPVEWQVVRHFDFVGMRKELREKLIYEE